MSFTEGIISKARRTGQIEGHQIFSATEPSSSCIVSEEDCTFSGHDREIAADIRNRPLEIIRGDLKEGILGSRTAYGLV